MTQSTGSNGRLVAFALLAADMATPLGACATINGQESAPQYVSDASLTAKVKADIIKDQTLKGFAIGVETLHHVVQLSGFVDTPQQTGQAAAIAQAVPGVQPVQNNILVRSQNGPA
jgi:osmotically-inducible protein OsmY